MSARGHGVKCMKNKTFQGSLTNSAAVAHPAAMRRTSHEEAGGNAPLLRVEGLKMYFPIYRGVLRRRAGEIKAVDDISFDLYQGETLGLVGESGCGKSTTGRAILRLYDATAGRIELEGRTSRRPAAGRCARSGRGCR